MAKRSRKAMRPDVEMKNPGVLAVQARYDAASHGRRMAGWIAPATGPVAATTGLSTIRNRARDAGRNEWAQGSAARVMKTNLIGTGIVARPKTKNKSLKEKLVAEWDRWVEVADADGVLDFYGLQALVVGTWFEAGEVFVRLRQRRLNDGLPAPMQVQVLEPDFVPVFDADNWPGMPKGHTIRQGIERDRVGRRAAYWFHRQHPGDKSTIDFGINELVRVPADQVMHVFNPKRPGQIRGVPESAPVLAKLRSVMDFDDAVLTRQQLANLFTAFITRPMPTGVDASIDPLTGKTVQYDNGGAPMASLEPGISQELLPGESVEFSSPPDAGANYAEFMRAQHLGLASGVGVPYELVTGDIKDVSDRTLRVTLNEFRRYCEQVQWTLIIPKLCKPVRAAWANSALLAGVLSESEAAEALLVDWSPHGWAYIHPVQDVQAKALEVESGFRSRSSVITERGDDPESVDAARAEDSERELDLGITLPPPDPLADPVKQAEADKAEAEAEQAKENVKAMRIRTGDAHLAAVASIESQRAQAEKSRADAALLMAKAKEAEANAKLLDARADLEKAEAGERMAAAVAANARAENESAARVAALEETAEAARVEANAKAKSLSEADAFAREQRDLVLAAEKARAEAAALELEAARLGLNELRGE